MIFIDNCILWLIFMKPHINRKCNAWRSRWCTRDILVCSATRKTDGVSTAPLQLLRAPGLMIHPVIWTGQPCWATSSSVMPGKVHVCSSGPLNKDLGYSSARSGQVHQASGECGRHSLTSLLPEHIPVLLPPPVWLPDGIIYFWVAFLLFIM